MSPAASPSAASDGRAALDALAGRLLAAVPELRVAVATGAAEREAIARLRHRQVFGHAGGVEQDDYDAAALQVGAWDAAGALVGGMRLVLPEPGRPLPVEAAFELRVPPHGAVAEAGRLVIAPECRGDPAHRAWGALFACTWLELRARGLAVLAGAASPRMVERLRGVGLPFEILAPARPYWGEPRHPVRLDPARGRPGWFDP
jgi:hypothetical protein